MKKVVLIIALCLFLIDITYAQVADGEKKLREQKNDSIQGWKSNGLISLNFSQTSLTNWASGGQNSIAGNSVVSLSAGYKKKKLAWDNSLDIGYGMLRQGIDDLRKTDDKIDLVSKYGRFAKNDWYIAMLFNFKTQFTAGYNYPNDSVRISDFLAPAYTLFAAGMDYKPQKKALNIFVAPITGKITSVKVQELADAGAFGVDKAKYDSLGNKIEDGKNIRYEFGGYMRVLYKMDVFENVQLQNKIDLFSNYIKNPQNIDVNWEIMLSMKINKFITSTITTTMIYDDDVLIAIDKNKDGIIEAKGPRLQFKEVFAIGFSYKFAHQSKQLKK